MKNKPSNRRRLSHFFTPRIHGKDLYNLLELVKPELKGTEIEPDNIQRWEDDGGTILLDIGPRDWSDPDMAGEKANQ